MKPHLRLLSTAYEYAVFGLGWLGLSLFCLAWSTLAAILYPLLPQALGQRIGRFMIMATFRSFTCVLQWSGLFRFDLCALDALRHEKALVIAPNHPSLWDAVLIASRLPDVACIMKAEIINNIFLGGGARLARYIRNESLRRMILMAVDNLRQGSHVLLFPEGTRTVRKPIGPLKGSVAVIACRARVPVQTVLVETDSPFLGKGWPLLRKPPLPMTYRVRLGRRFEPSADSAALMAELEQYFTHELSGQSAPAAAQAIVPQAVLAD
ncbi:MAG: lysophospholipid acyltransferase family protein [Noviherbaspirillum sp.]